MKAISTLSSVDEWMAAAPRPSQSIPHGHLIPFCPHADLCGKGKSWLVDQAVAGGRAPCHRAAPSRVQSPGRRSPEPGKLLALRARRQSVVASTTALIPVALYLTQLRIASAEGS